MLVKDLIADNVRPILNDPNGTRWPDGTLLKFWNEGQRAAIVVKPAITATRATIDCVAGVVQSIPATGIVLIDVESNHDGSNPGAATSYLSESVLDDIFPGWRAETPAAGVLYYCHDSDAEPKKFKIYPPSPAGATDKLQILYGDEPTDCTINGVNGGGVDSQVEIGNEYGLALCEFTLFRAFAQQKEEGSQALAEGHLAKFMAAIGG